MESNEKIVDALNQLIQINNDRIEGYERASKETNETDLKMLFERFASKSNMFKSQLNSEVVKRGGKPNESTTASGKIFRVWMDFKAALTGKDRKAILSSCEFGEDAAQEEYDNVIKSGIGLPSDVMQIITSQKSTLRIDHDEIKKLRDLAVHEK
jgi:uncharacterized protein (TIGR02284 family)